MANFRVILLCLGNKIAESRFLFVYRRQKDLLLQDNLLRNIFSLRGAWVVGFHLLLGFEKIRCWPNQVCLVFLFRILLT